MQVCSVSFKTFLSFEGRFHFAKPAPSHRHVMGWFGCCGMSHFNWPKTNIAVFNMAWTEADDTPRGPIFLGKLEDPTQIGWASNHNAHCRISPQAPGFNVESLGKCGKLECPSRGDEFPDVSCIFLFNMADVPFLPSFQRVPCGGGKGCNYQLR